MASPGPPPYTSEQINAMTSPEERLRARAELNSYIARMKKEKQERLTRESHLSNGYFGYAGSAPSSPYRNTTGTGYAGSYNSFQHPIHGHQRGGYSYGRGGPSAYHPYQRPPPLHVAHKFKNKSVTFNKSDLYLEASEAKKVATLTSNSTHSRQGNQQQTEQTNLCPAFTLTGVCTRHGCRHLHDPNKQAVCKRWLFKGDCPKGDSCPLSHTPSPHNAPTCQHFQEGRCNNDKCRFAHIRINPAASNCEAFGLVGYCEKGASCPELHAHECPHFSNTGTCPFGDKCRLGHVHRASRMRKTTRHPSEGRSSPSDGPEEDMGNTRDQPVQNPHQFTQQVDFVPFDPED